MLSTMLAKKPDERFQTPIDLLAALTTCIEQLGLTPPQIAMQSYKGTWSPPIQFWRRHVPWLVPTALLFLIVLVLGIVWNRNTTVQDFPELRVPASLKTKGQTGTPVDIGVEENPTG
jgi:hypothetical protein